MGTIYAIFPGKTELFTAILEERGRELLALVEEIADAPGSPRVVRRTSRQTPRIARRRRRRCW